MFTQACLLRKNTAEIREKLEQLGYHLVENGFNEWHIPIEKLWYIETYEKGVYMGTNGNWNSSRYLDCGRNEEMFLALAALRDDSDKFQWFRCDIDDGDCAADGVLTQCTCDKIEDHIKQVERYYDEVYNVHKLTPKEIIEHFRTTHE